MATATSTSTTSTFSATELRNLIETTELVKEIANLTEAIKERDTLLQAKKKRLAELLPDGEVVRVQDPEDPTKVIKAEWAEKLTKTLQKALVEANHNVKLEEADYKVTPSRYVSVAKVKA